MRADGCAVKCKLRWRWNRQSQGRRQRAFAGLFVVALHVALGALWHASVTGLPRHAGPAPAQRLSVRLIPWRAAPTPLPPRAEAPAVRPTRSAPAAALSRPRMPAPTDRITPPPMPLDRAVVTVTPAVLFWNNTLILQICALVFVVGYVYAYTSIIRFKVPRWLRR